MLRVMLVSMPFGSLERPALGLGLLQAQLVRQGLACETRYLSFAFADFVGLEEYLWVSGELPYTAFAGDWSFSASLYGERPESDRAYIAEILQEQWRLDEAQVARLLRVRAYCEPFLDHCVRAIRWGHHDVVGFTSTFEQNIASLALARRLKAAHPDLRIAFGGANWEGEMGEELHRRFPFVDLVCSGEADHSFPALLAALDASSREPTGVPGIVYRDRHGRTRATGRAPLVRDLDALPFPDFDPFFRDKAASPAAACLTPSLLLETGRGCWWGAKSHCTFCGLNGGSMAFRSKGPERALAEIRHLRQRYGTDALSAVDNILDLRYFGTLLPRLAREEQGLSLFYEVKANLSAEQVALLAAAGVNTIQPGLESMSDAVLKLMRKGTTALQNVQLLKWCREHSVQAEWNLLYGFPGESPAEYAAMLELFEAISFLDPPSGYGPVRLDRFSPYHEDPAASGMYNVRPMAPYRYLYPFPTDALARIAYYFDYDHADGREPLEYARPLLESVTAWMADRRRGGLWCVQGSPGRTILVDERPTGSRSVPLEGWQATAYEACDRVQGRSKLGRAQELAAVPQAALDGFLDWCVDQRLMLRRGERYLALAVHAPARAWTAHGASPEAAQEAAVPAA